ncbi:MAG: hypothetical protein DRJ07_01525 [Bacteroidetes bacterium]|nr:MAG: hypothetical protein DRJ07_01525 [Bacteroidota bacterium]
MKLFSKNQIVFTAILAGPLPAAYLLSKNYLNIKQKRASLITRAFGYLLALISYLSLILLVDQCLIQSGIFKQNRVVAYGFVVILFLVIQSIIAISFYLVSNKIILKEKLGFPDMMGEMYSSISAVPYLLVGMAITSYLFIEGPFRFLLFIIYLLPNVYLFHKIKELFPKSSAKDVFTTIFIVWIALFPIVMMAYNVNGGVVLRYLRLVTFNYLPVLLYFFLFYLFNDLILLTNRKFKIIPEEFANGNKYKIWTFLTILIFTVVIMAKGMYNFNNTAVNEYHISVSKKDALISHLKIVMTADVHLNDKTNEDFVNQLIKNINFLNPDIVLLAGDIIDSRQVTERMKVFEQQFCKIKSKMGVFAVEGNHEIYSGEYKRTFYENTDIIVLKDSVLKIQDSFYLIGRKDRHDNKRKSIEELLRLTSDDLPLILLDHQPYNLNNAYNNNIDIQLSGHTHHGQLFPINLITERIYELSWGYRKIQNTHFFVTCGAQGWGPQVKIGSRSEIMEINIDFE